MASLGHFHTKTARHGDIALVIEENAVSSLILASLGFTIEAYHPRALATAVTQRMTAAIRAGRFGFIWMELPQRKQSVQVGKRTAVYSEMSSWLRAARAVGVMACLIGTRGHAWQNQSLADLLTEGAVTETHHQLCRYGLTIVNDPRPSEVIYVALTSFPAEHGKCQCTQGVEHHYDLKPPLKDRHYLKLQTEATLFRTLLKTWLPSHTTAKSSDASYRTVDLEGNAKDPGQKDYPTIVNTTTLPSSVTTSTIAVETQSPVTAFPTEAREFAKERKKAGHKAVKKVKVVEDHNDDLGDDLSGLGADLSMFTDGTYPGIEAPASSDNESEEELVEGLLLWTINGPSHYKQSSDHVITAHTFEQALQYLETAGPGYDICELCGGAARTSQVAIRRRLKTGKNFDLVTNVDLGIKKHQDEFLHYVEIHNVLVVVMSPSCRTLGPPSSVNYTHNYDTWRMHYEEDRPHIAFCGRVALLQLRNGRHFFCEQPSPTWLWHVDPWPQLGKSKQVLTRRIHQCKLGQVGPKGLPAKKPTELIASAEELLTPFSSDRCQNDHQHDECWGHRAHLHGLQVWTWEFATKVVEGVVRLKARLRRTNQSWHAAGVPSPGTRTSHEPTEDLRQPLQAYPEAAVGGDPTEPQEEEEEDKGEAWRKCPGCAGNMARSRREHNRTPGICKYPLHPPEPEWECPGCSRIPARPPGHSEHTMEIGKCRWISTTSRNSTTKERKKQHPREASRRAEASAEVDVPGDQLNRDITVTEPTNRQAAPANPHSIHEQEQAAREASSSSGEGLPARATRGPDRGPRDLQPRVREAAVGNESTPDWTSFDINKSLRVLRSGNDAQKRREVRKLHLRWWHSGRAEMERIFRSAGLPQEILDMVPDTIQTCRTCRTWESPGQEPTPTVELVIKQDEQVEADIMFYRRHLIWHMLDRADRWHAACEIEGKQSETLCEAMDTTWFQIHGPFKILVVDGERGIHSTETEAFLKRKGITIRTRAPGQHARMIERRGALLRHAMHHTETQLEKESVIVTFKQLLAEAVFAGNSLVSIGGATPYNARFGRQPRMLPDITAMPNDTAPGAGRHMHRMREVALQRMIESTAVARINRALRTNTTTAGEVLDYKPGELVDWHRPSATKDSSGWMGPATVIKAHPSRGTVVLKTDKGEVTCRFGDVRRFLDFFTLAYGAVDTPGTGSNAVVKIIEQHISQMEPHRFQLIGFTKDSQKWNATTETRKNAKLALALEHFVSNVVHYEFVVSVRLGKGVAKFPGAKHTENPYYCGGPATSATCKPLSLTMLARSRRHCSLDLNGRA